MPSSEPNRVLDPRSPFTALQQRLRYVSQFPERDWTNIVENVPRWPRPVPALVPENGCILKYAPCEGSARLVDAVATREQAIHRTSIRGDQIVITNGGMHAISLVVRSTARPGKIALVQAPVFISVAEILRDAGMELVYFSPDDERVDVEALAPPSSIGLIYLNSPNNPTGSVLPAGTMRRLVELAQRCGAAVLLDAVYDSFTFGASPLQAPLASCEWDRVYVVNSMSKNYGAPGLRVGWVLTSQRNALALAALLERECVAIAGPSQDCAAELIASGNAELVAEVREGREFVRAALPALRGAHFTDPAGGTQVAVQLPVDDVEAFGDYALTELGLVLATRSQYAGAAGPFIRFPLGAPRDLQQRALELLATALTRFRGVGD